MADSVLQTV